MTDILTPVNRNTSLDFAGGKGSRLSFWKQVLPKKIVHYTDHTSGKRKTIDFRDEKMLSHLATAPGKDEVDFMLAPSDNSHTMDPERRRGKVSAMEVRDDGLYARIDFPDADSAKAVLSNPNLGVSARIRPNIEKSDGTVNPLGIIHILGTLDPQISGMKPWEKADLSAPGDDVLDLSSEEYDDMAKKKKLDDYTEADLDGMTDEELDEFLAEHAPSVADLISDEDGDEPDSDSDEEDENENDDPADEDEDDTEDEENLVGVGADMSKFQASIDLANARANEALRRAAEAEWKAEREKYLGEGVPPWALDLAAPILTRADDMVIDLSNEGGPKDVNASETVRKLLDGFKGTVDLSAEAGHGGTFRSGDGDDPDAEMLTAWGDQYGK